MISDMKNHCHCWPIATVSILIAPTELSYSINKFIIAPLISTKNIGLMQVVYGLFVRLAVFYHSDNYG